jgi:hypothetical protein
MQGMIAEYERAKIMERSRRGKRHAARCGSINVLCGAPYGYRYISKHASGGQAQYSKRRTSFGKYSNGLVATGSPCKKSADV